MTAFNVAIVGATGAVGSALIEALDAADFVAGELYLLASAASSGDTAMYRKRPAMIEDVAGFDFSSVELVFFAVPEHVSQLYAESAVEAGCRVIDFSCCFRDDPAVPLVVAGINSHLLDDGSARLVALPDSLAVDLSHVLKPVHDDVEIVRVNVATYQAVSSAGQAGVKELAGQSTSLLGGVTVKPQVFGKQIAFNVLPQVGELRESGHADAELRLVSEVCRVIGAPLAMSVTCVQVPVFYGFCQAVSLETRYPLDVEGLIELLKQVGDLKVVATHSKQGYPVPVTGSGVLPARSVGRIRASIAIENGLDLWIVSDNVRKGAVDNAINVARLLLKGAQ